MNRLRIAIHGSARDPDAAIALEALDIATALTIADINIMIITAKTKQF